MSYKKVAMLSKANLRVQIKKKLNNLSSDDIDNKSLSINSNLFKFLNSVKFNSLCIFLPASTEPQLDVKKILISYDNIYCPKYINNEYKFSKTNSESDIIEGKFKISEPAGESFLDEATLKSKTTLFLVPCVGFDLKGNRIGHGNGYYDRLLDSTTGFKIGIAYSIQQVSKINYEKHDQKLNFVITENNILDLN